MATAERKLVTKLRKKDVPAAPQQASMPEYEDTTEYEQYQEPEETASEIDEETGLPYADIPGVEESVGPDDLVGPGELKAGAAVLKGLAAKGAPALMIGSMKPIMSNIAKKEIQRLELDMGRKFSQKEAELIAAQVDKKIATTPGKEFASSVKEGMSAAPVSERELQQEVIRDPKLMELRGKDKEAAMAAVQAQKDAVAKQAYALKTAKEQGSKPLPATKSYQEMLDSQPIGTKVKPKEEERVYRMNSFQTDQRPGFHESESENVLDYSGLNKPGGIIKKIKRPE